MQNNPETALEAVRARLAEQPYTQLLGAQVSAVQASIASLGQS